MARFQFLVSLIFGVAASVKLPLYGTLQGDRGRVRKRSTDIAVTGQPEQGYCIDIYLGTPPQEFSVVVDTGSSNFALAGAASSGIDKYFVKSDSTTWEDSTEVTDVSVNYFSGSWEGAMGNDTFKFCQTCASGTVDVALITTADKFFENGTLWQGILGLAYDGLMQPSPGSADPVLYSMVDADAISDTFSMTLCGRENQDSIQLNGVMELDVTIPNESDYKFTDIVQEWFYQIMVADMKVDGKSLDLDCYEYNKPVGFIDSGTTNIVLPSPVYQPLCEAVAVYAADKIADADDLTEDNITLFMARQQGLCLTDKTRIFSIFPELSVSIAHNVTHAFAVNLPAEQYVRQTWDTIEHQKQYDPPRYCYMFGIEKDVSNVGTILGAAFMEQMDVVHDRSRQRVGFKLSDDCSVSDPVFNKTISDMFKRSDRGDCSSPAALPSWIVPVASICGFILIVSLTLVYWIYTSRDFLRRASFFNRSETRSGATERRPARPSRVSSAVVNDGSVTTRAWDGDREGTIIENTQTTVQGNDPDDV